MFQSPEDFEPVSMPCAVTDGNKLQVAAGRGDFDDSLEKKTADRRVGITKEEESFHPADISTICVSRSVWSKLSEMRILNKREVGEVCRREPYRSNAESRFVRGLVEQGPGRFVSNARASARALETDSRIIPVIVSDGSSGNSSVCSLLAHYVESPSSQLAQLGSRIESVLARPFLKLLGGVLRAGRLGRVCYLNDWLMTTNPQSHFEEEQIDEATGLLTAKYPDRAVVVRSVNELTRPGLPDLLRRRGYQLTRSRRIYIFDPGKPDFRMKENLRKDLRKLRHWEGTITRAPLDTADIKRVAALYRGLYLHKYTSGNPEFTDEYFRTVINEGLFETRCLVKGGQILAFTAWKPETDFMLGTLIGYDLTRPRKEGLLRMAFALDFEESLRRMVPYHISSGAGYFKRLRGAVATTEYDAIFYRHLPAKTRVYWWMFRALMLLAEKLEGERIDFKKAPAS